MADELPHTIEITADRSKRTAAVDGVDLWSFEQFIQLASHLGECDDLAMLQNFYIRYTRNSEGDTELFNEATYKRALRQYQGETLQIFLVSKEPDRILEQVEQIECSKNAEIAQMTAQIEELSKQNLTLNEEIEIIKSENNKLLSDNQLKNMIIQETKLCANWKITPTWPANPTHIVTCMMGSNSLYCGMCKRFITSD